MQLFLCKNLDWGAICRYHRGMFRAISLTIFTLLVAVFACRAEAGVISQQWESDSVNEIGEADFEMATTPIDDHSPIVQDLDRENSAAGGGTPVISLVGHVGVLPSTIQLPTPSPLIWDLRFENSVLPPSPVLDGLLKPS